MIIMKKTWLLIALFLVPSFVTLAQDSLSTGEKQLLILFGSIFSEAKHEIIKDARTNGNKSIIGNALLETMKGLVNKTKDQVIAEGKTTNWIDLPNVLQQKKSLLISRGKSSLIQNFTSSLKDAAWNALNNSLYTMVDQVTEIKPESLITIATAETVSITDIFYNANKNKMIKAITPIAKTAFKLSGGKKLYKKIDRELKKSGSEALNIDHPEYIATAATEYFFKLIKDQESGIKKDPLKAVDSILDLLFRKKD
jgi:hypothetical protein